MPCPQYLKCIAALMCSYPPFHTIHSHALGTSRVCWHALAFSRLLDTSGTHWNILEPPGTYTTLKEPSWILLDVPCPQYLKCIVAQICSYSPLHIYNTFTCSGGPWGVLASVGILPTTGYYWNILEHIGTTGTYTTL